MPQPRVTTTPSRAHTRRSKGQRPSSATYLARNRMQIPSSSRRATLDFHRSPEAGTRDGVQPRGDTYAACPRARVARGSLSRLRWPPSRSDLGEGDRAAGLALTIQIVGKALARVGVGGRLLRRRSARPLGLRSSLEAIVAARGSDIRNGGRTASRPPALGVSSCMQRRGRDRLLRAPCRPGASAAGPCPQRLWACGQRGLMASRQRLECG